MQQCTKYFISGIDYILNIDSYVDKCYSVEMQRNKTLTQNRITFEEFHA